MFFPPKLNFCFLRLHQALGNQKALSSLYFNDLEVLPDPRNSSVYQISLHVCVDSEWHSAFFKDTSMNSSQWPSNRSTSIVHIHTCTHTHVYTDTLLKYRHVLYLDKPSEQLRTENACACRSHGNFKAIN